MPPAMTPSTITVTVTKPAGRFATASPTRRQNEWPSARPVSPTCGTFGQKIQRPKTTRAAGSTTSAKVAATTTPTAQARPSPRVAGKSESSRVSRPSTTVVALESTASAVRLQGDGHGLAAVRGDPQLVAVAADQEQRVVGTGTEDEHREDADRRLVPEHVEGGEGVRGQHGGQLVGDADDGERHQPEERAAVGDDEQDRHDGCRGREQAEVRAVEHGREVGLDGRRAGDLRGEALGQVGLGGGAQVGDHVSGLDGILGRDRDEHRCGGSVLGRPRPVRRWLRAGCGRAPARGRARPG